MKTYRRERGFTLVEILIVVIILGILAAVVIPQFTSASEDARLSSARSQVQTLRSQIELYKLQHRDALPDIIGVGDPDMWQVFLEKTDEDGVIGTTAGVHRFGPYMQSAPVNPLNGQTTVVNGTTAPAATDGPTTGFVYDYDGGQGSGRIWAVYYDRTLSTPAWTLLDAN